MICFSLVYQFFQNRFNFIYNMLYRCAISWSTAEYSYNLGILIGYKSNWETPHIKKFTFYQRPIGIANVGKFPVIRVQKLINVFSRILPNG